MIETTTPHHTHHVARALLWTLGSVLTIYIVLTIGYAWGGWSGSTAVRVANWVPTPIAWQGWKPIWQRDFLTIWKAQETFRRYTQASGAALAQPTGDDRVTAMQTLIRNMVATKELQKFDQVITTTDIDQAFTAQLGQTGDAAAIAKALRELYDWTPEQYKRYVTQLEVSRSFLQEQLAFDDTAGRAQRNQANDILVLVKEAKASFADLAKKYSEDAYGPSGGEMGFVGRGELAQELEDAAFRLKKNEVSDVVTTKYGYHILKVEDQRQQDGQDEVLLRQIFVAAPNVDQVITASAKNTRTTIWALGLRWDASTGKVVSD